MMVKTNKQKTKKSSLKIQPDKKPEAFSRGLFFFFTYT